MKSDRVSVHRVGITAARAVGTAILGGGGLAALVVGGTLVWLFPQGIVGYAVGVLIAAVAAVVGGSMLLGARRVETRIARAEDIEWEHRLVELTRTRGAFTAGEAGRALGITAAEADAYVSRLAKERPDDFAVDIDNSGALVYRALRAGRLRIGTPGEDGAALDGSAQAGGLEGETAASRRASGL